LNLSHQEVTKKKAGCQKRDVRDRAQSKHFNT
jgi:hypothetical protein